MLTQDVKIDNGKAERLWVSNHRLSDSRFWRRLAEEFRTRCRTHGMLRADRYYKVGSGEPAIWTVRGGASPTASIQFETLARRGASRLPSVGSSDLLFVWLEAVMRNSANFKWDDREGTEVNDDGSDGAHHMTGTLARADEASADFCDEQEGKALEAEALQEEIEQLKGTLDQLKDALDKEIAEPVRPATAGAESELPKKSFATPLGRNLDRLKREAGWSFDEMAKATEIDKKLILGHVNKGKSAYPRTLASYACAFTEKLGRPVTVAELEG